MPNSHSVLAQDLIQAPVKGVAGRGKCVVETHIVGCRSRLRLPSDMGEV
jgi:hypothetical protein